MRQSAGGGMSVIKYKPTQIPRLFEELQQANLERTERVARTTQQQLERSNKLLKQTRAALEKAQALRRETARNAAQRNGRAKRRG